MTRRDTPIILTVKIPKGTFYLFYQSKEMLLFEVILEQHNLMDQKILDEISNIDKNDFTVEKLTEVIVHFYPLIDEIPVFKILNSDEIDTQSLSAAFRAIYFTTLHKDKIGEENFGKALYLLVYGLVNQLI